MQTIASKLSEALVISVTPDGAVESLHKDQFDLGFLGDKKVCRATEITFNDATQKWDIVLMSPTGVPQPAHTMHTGQLGFSSYDQARKVEVSWLNRCRLASVNPLSNGESIVCLRDARNEVIPLEPVTI